VQKSRSLDLGRKVSEFQLRFPELVYSFLISTVHLGKGWCGTALGRSSTAEITTSHAKSPIALAVGGIGWGAVALICGE